MPVTIYLVVFSLRYGLVVTNKGLRVLVLDFMAIKMSRIIPFPLCSICVVEFQKIKNLARLFLGMLELFIAKEVRDHSHFWMELD